MSVAAIFVTQIAMALPLFIIAVTALLLHQGADAKQGYGPGEQDWGHIDVRDGAHMFYWLFETQAQGASPTDKPLVIWLQGGPGADSTGYGNFAEIGPLHINGSARASSWAQYANLLFIDNPVGTGFSYVDRTNLLTTTNEQIGADMVNFLIEFYRLHPTYTKVPLFIFCESYGGKMTAEIAKQLNAAIKAGKLKIDFRGVALGDSWISPLDSVMTWGPFLLQTGVVDQAGYDAIVKGANNVKNLIGLNQWQLATNAWGNLEGTIGQVSHGVDFYNILYKIGSNRKAKSSDPMDILYNNHVTPRDEQDDTGALMNGPVRKALGIPSSISFGGQSGQVFSQLSADFMKPVVSVVAELLDNTDVKVYVLTGQLDLIVDTPGTVQWVDNMAWSGASRWKTAARNTLVVDGYIEGYVKTVDNLALYWVDRAGHMIPTDNPAASVAILRRIIEK